MHARRLTRSGRLILLVALGLIGSKPLAALQQFDRGRNIRNIEVTVDREPYELHGSTGEEILRELRTLSPSVGWYGYALFYTWRYDAERVMLAGGFPSANCVPRNFRMVLNFELVYPEWTRPPDVPDELVAAWDAFADLLDGAWIERRDNMIAKARIALDEVPRMEELCEGLDDRIQAFLIDTYEAELPARLAAEQAEGVRWPPIGHEAVLRAPPERAAVSAAYDGAPPPGGSSGPPRRTLAPGTLPLGAPPGPSGTPGAQPVPIAQPALDVMQAAELDLGGFSGRSTPTDGFVMGVMHEGRLQFLEAFGVDPETGAPMELERVFAFPAFTEVLVSTLAAALGEVGILDLDAPIGDELEWLGPRMGSATLGQLLSHRAGIDNAPARDTTMAWSDVLDRLGDLAMMTDPGIVYSYSRYSYGLAVRVIESRLEMSVEDAIRQTVLDPLGLENTTLGARDAEDALYDLPVTHTTVPDLMLFWLAAMRGELRGSEPAVLATVPPGGGEPGSGHSFHRGAWVDRVGGDDRVTLLCSSGGTSAGFQVLPGSGSIVAVGSLGGVPLRTTIFALSRIGEALGVGDEIYGPRPLDGGAAPSASPSRCEVQHVTWTNLVMGLDAPVAPDDWPGRYLNGEMQFVLDAREGELITTRGDEDPLEIHHFDGDTYFASIPREAGPPPFAFPIELFRDDQGRRYVRVGERVYLHEEDRTP